MFFAPINIIGGMFEIQSETHVGLYVKYSLLTKGITCRLQILVEHTSIIFNRFYFAALFMTFRSRLLADIWGVVRTDRQGKLIGLFKVFATKTTKEGRNKETKNHNLNPKFTMIRYLSPQPGNRSSFSSFYRSYGNIGPPQESPACTIPCHLVDSWLWGRYSRGFPSDWDHSGTVVNKRLGGMVDRKFLW